MKNRLPLRAAIVSLLLSVGVPVNLQAGEQSTNLVTWQNRSITVADFEAFVRQYVPEQRRDEVLANEGSVRGIVENLVNYRILADDARSRQLDKSPAYQQELQVMTDRLLAYKRVEALESSEIKRPDFLPIVKEQYEVNKEKYREPDQLHASHILISTEKRSDDEAKALADELRAKAIAGDDFASLAAEHSDDKGSREKGGDLGTFTRGKMVPQFEDMAYSLQKAGDISPPVRTRFGYHVIRLTERKQGRLKPFDEVKDGLIKTFEEKLVNDQKALFLSKLKADAQLSVDQDLIKSLIKIPLIK
jgi:peptidyl-prolyl cis-trans isomerase C